VTRTVRLPADVDRPDRILAGLTARQLAYLAVATVVLGSTYRPLAATLPPAAVAALLAPPAVAALLLALGRVDGVGADVLARAWLRHRRHRAPMVPAPDGIPALPAWAGGDPRCAPLAFPAAGFDDGVVDLGDAGAALLARASSLNFGLRTDDEQQTVVAAVGRWLNSLTGPVQIVVRAERADVTALVDAVEDAAPALPHPALEDAAREHARFLRDLAARRDVLRRTVLVVFTAPAGPDAAAALRRRAEDSTGALAAAGITLTPLSDDEAVAALAHAAEPDAPPRPVGLALPGATIHGAGA